jgi:cellulose synthase/poly-beta-1,6-N-acetylglucosamine synthase-like glycosyltransferase
MFRNYRYALKKCKKIRKAYHPRTALIVPCKGLDRDFKKNIASLFNLDYDDYILWFVVDNQSDPAYNELHNLKEQLSKSSKARDIRILVAGNVIPQSCTAKNGETKKYSCSQKIHNLLYCCRRIDKDVEIIAFADSDICVRTDWLGHLVFPLRKAKHGASTGYRWFVPQKNNLATLALSSINAKIAQLLGETIFNQAWGGSMAIRTDTFREIALDKIWAKTLSDDLSLSVAVKKAGKKIIFAPACLVTSYEQTTWKELFEFGRRQFLITRISAPGTWWFGLFSSLYSIFGLWGGAAIALYASSIKNIHTSFFTAVPILFFAGQLTRAILRQNMVAKLLEKDLPKMKIAMAVDILLFWIWSPLLLILILSSIVGRTISWRGVRYKLLSPTETIILEN